MVLWLHLQVKSMKDDNPLVLFSGDAFSPSSMSSVTLGSHMPPVLNSIGIRVACIGNHDFDLGLATCTNLVKECKFPWLMSNVRDAETGWCAQGIDGCQLPAVAADAAGNCNSLKMLNN